ncbi:MAG: hypothetical protein PHD56_06405 [Anaerostipes sp.]|nr:hypothetical protein [Anaerostipes sp.]
MNISGFLNRFKVKESSDYKEDQERIMNLHKEKEVFSYVEEIYQEEGQYVVKAIFVRGCHKHGEEIALYNCHGKLVGTGWIQGISMGEQEDKSEQSEAGEKGTIYFELIEGDIKDIFLAQYISKND